MSPLATAHNMPLTAGHTGCFLAVLPLMTARRDDAEVLLGSMMQLLHKVSVFRHISHDQLSMMVQKAESYAYCDGEAIVRQGESDSRLYILASGKANVIVNGRIVRRLNPCSYFGERTVLFDEPHSGTVRVASEEAEIWIFNKACVSKVSEQLSQRAHLRNEGVTLQDLQKLKAVGSGTSGTVHLVCQKSTNLRYALKKLDKVDGKVPADVQREISVLSENDHPFLLHMVKTFETAASTYVLMEYVGGGELHAAIRSIPSLLTRPQAMFYIGSMVLMLEALQDRHIVYRDLKPENLILDAEGYLKLVDFGTAKQLEARCGRTFTQVGTTHYMAPEVMRGKGYGLDVDVWALGVVLYELVIGSLPFGDKAESQREVCKEVLAGHVKVPSDLEVCTKDLIVGMLEQRPRQRLGCGTEGLGEIKASSFFEVGTLTQRAYSGEADKAHEYFDKLLSREIVAPITPKLDKVDAENGGIGSQISDVDEEIRHKACRGENEDEDSGASGLPPQVKYQFKC
eukprot:TRINITY_DN19789_c0_g1_i1.p1 TRINITY_DN19789_c0_g1~~TRINITY_DN19789_c0_g1_i1.p1  ORF type:complete len:583 (-),score=113.80 TRINITY_DN19789_c0_g1_i1:345-1883(-)